MKQKKLLYFGLFLITVVGSWITSGDESIRFFTLACALIVILNVR